MKPSTSAIRCGKTFGRGLGGVLRTCLALPNHSYRCTDMPFLTHLKDSFPKIAEKIERDSFQTRGASWGRDSDGRQARRNRQPRWTLKPGDVFYPKHHQAYAVCLTVAAELTLQAYEMVGAPDCPSSASVFLPKAPAKDQGTCPICRLPMEFADFSAARQSLAAIDTDHLNPTIKRRHVPGNVAFVHHICNTTKGDRSIEDFVHWMVEVLRRFDFNVQTN